LKTLNISHVPFMCQDIVSLYYES